MVMSVTHAHPLINISPCAQWYETEGFDTTFLHAATTAGSRR
eukprot:COSAG01_NODE_715_length_14093_cov_64.209233_3_plen_42_part_00